MQYQKLGIQTYRALLSLSLSLLRLFFSFSHVGKWVKYSFLWANTLKFQKKLVNSQCGLFLPLRLSSCSIACSVISNTMFDLSLLLTSSCVTLCFRIILCWVLVLKSGLAKLGAALSVSLSYWTHALLLGWYMKYSSSCSEACGPVSKELFQGIWTGLSPSYSFCFYDLVIFFSLLPYEVVENSSFYHLLYFDAPFPFDNKALNGGFWVSHHPFRAPSKSKARNFSFVCMVCSL